jgi:hypothetical protein
MLSIAMVIERILGITRHSWGVRPRSRRTPRSNSTNTTAQPFHALAPTPARSSLSRDALSADSVTPQRNPVGQR